MDVSAGVTQEGHTGFLIHLPSAALALIFIARRIQPFLSLVDREVEFRVLTGQLFSTCWAFLGKIPVRVTAPRFELTSQRQKVSRLPTEPPGRPSIVNSNVPSNLPDGDIIIRLAWMVGAGAFYSLFCQKLTTATVVTSSMPSHTRGDDAIHRSSNSHTYRLSVWIRITYSFDG